jgi:hypothetical protein
VLISQGYCATFGIEVPAPFYLQTLVSDIYPDPNYFVNRDTNASLNALQSVINSAEDTSRDMHVWAEHITGERTCWWNYQEGDVASLASFLELDALFFNKLKEVCLSHFDNETHRIPVIS